MASLCKRQQCTLERRGFRQELDSWRHKLIHCVGFESILEGLFGPGVVKDSTTFQDCEPEEVSDWSFDDNCLFCCLRRENIKDHSSDDTVASGQLLLEGEDAKREQTRLSRLERQAQDFLNAVFHRKDLPNLSDPHIPLVAREIMQRMIRQFAAEYTSKTTQDAPLPPLPPNGAMKDQSLPPCSPPPPGPTPGSPPSSASCSLPSPCLSPPGTEGGATAAAASAQNPVLSKLLMADQDGPLDLTVKKNLAETETPAQQDGVLDLSTKKNQCDKQGFSSPHGLKGHPVEVDHSVKVEHSVKVDHSVPDADEDDGVLPQSFQDGLRDNLINSFKPPLARSLRIKEELLSQKHRLLSQPAALSLASLESVGLFNRDQSHSLLGQKGSSSFWGSKAHLESLMKLKQASGALSGALGGLKDLPTFLEKHHNHHGAFSFKNSLLHHHNQVSKTQHNHHDAKRDQSPPVDLKIPQVRGMDLSWDSSASELYGFGGIGPGGGGGLSENALSRKLRAILPKQNRRGASLGSLLDGAAEYWTADLEHSASGPAYSTSDVEGDPNSKQPRKKRGRYRQYNTEILEEAIAVVMSGKMSVSKAQNMYGIPHSTLEYKVKERMGTLKNPPKKKLKLMMKMEVGGPEFPGDAANTPAIIPRNDAATTPPSLGPAELKVDVKEEMEHVD
ncbi:ligand-dependent corepressor [Phyllopteryx taeniolatus]|uniref:ligand-dependent corepressor n=1 Tax=Phyllopteryx taeniolatus TaxID=161469 RepID=UPI002AD4EF42|nr:ligand-dependent corepressor [Phyllopteryx taeniolatus]